MFNKTNLIAAVLALCLFSYAQYRGLNLFDDVAESSRGSGHSSRTYHK